METQQSFNLIEKLNNTDSTHICNELRKKETEIDKRLKEILHNQCNIESKMRNIPQTLTHLSSVNIDAVHLRDMISHTAVLAEKVSAKVRRLDEARGRVSECQQRVHDLIDLQLCSQGVITAIKDENFEKGAGHVNRFLAMDLKLLQRTANDVSDSVISVSQAFNTLEEATKQLRQIVTQKFDDAVKKDDLASVERFFKIFPLLGMNSEGIKYFLTYICSKLDIKAQKELKVSMDIARAEKRTPVAFADTLMVLFENIARVIEVNQPIIDTYYHPGNLIAMVNILQEECDQEIKNLIMDFRKIRQIDRKTQQINDYIKKSGTANTYSHYRKPSGSSVDKLNPKDIDMLIGEITLMHSRAELYIKFLKKRIYADLENSSLEDDQKKEQLQKFENMLQKSGLARQMQEILGMYLLFERYFMEESVIKAISLDTFETAQQCSSMVDDIFFIIKKCIRRSISTLSLDGICAVINNAASCFESDYLNALRSPLKSGYPSGFIDLAQAYSAFQNTLQNGRIQTSDTEQARSNFIIHINNADMSVEYIDTLWKTIQEEIRCTFPSMKPRENDILESCLSGLKSVADSLKALVDFGMQQIRSSVIKPRLHTWVDQFLSFSHELNEEELLNYEAGETFVQSLIKQVDSLLNTFKHVLSTRNYDILVGILATDVCIRLERSLKKCKFNRLGGILFDSEVRTLGSYLASATSWSVRDKLTRLTQIATILNLDKISELSDYWDTSERGEATSWRLTPQEIRVILSLRSDFRMEDIKKIKL